MSVLCLVFVMLCSWRHCNYHNEKQWLHYLQEKPVLSGYSKIDKTNVLNGSLMKVESNAECSLGASCNTFDLH